MIWKCHALLGGGLVDDRASLPDWVSLQPRKRYVRRPEACCVHEISEGRRTTTSFLCLVDVMLIVW